VEGSANRHWVLAFFMWTVQRRPAVALHRYRAWPEAPSSLLSAALNLVAEEAEAAEAGEAGPCYAELVRWAFAAVVAVGEHRRSQGLSPLAWENVTRVLLEHMRLSPEAFFSEGGGIMLCEMCSFMMTHPRGGVWNDSMRLLSSDRSDRLMREYCDYTSAMAAEGVLRGERRAIRHVQLMVSGVRD